MQNLLSEDAENNFYKTYLAIAYLCLNEKDNYQPIYWQLLFENDEEELNCLGKIISDLGTLKFKQQQIELAIKLYEQSLEFNPEDTNTFYHLAQCLTQIGYFDDAIALWEELISYQPNHIVSYEQLGLLWQNLDEYEKAIAVYQQGLQSQPDNLHILSNLSFCYLKNNQLSLAKQYFELAINYHPKYYQNYGEIGYLYLLENNIEQGIKYLQKLCKYQLEIYRQYFNWYQNDIEKFPLYSNNIELNIQFLQALQNQSNLAEIAPLIGHLFFAKTLYQEASNYYKIALHHQIKSADIYHNLIWSLMNSQQIQETPLYIQKLEKLDAQKSNELKAKINSFSEKKEELNLAKSPSEYYETSFDFIEQKRFKDNYQAIKLDNIINLKPPQTIAEDIHPSFCFPPRITLPETFVLQVPQGRFYLREDEASSAVITPDNFLIGELSPQSPALSPNHPNNHPRHHSVFQHPFLPTIKKIHGTVVVLAGLVNNVYFHWLFDILPRFYLLELAQVNLSEVDYFLVDNRTNFQQESLAKLGIESDKILPICFPTHIQADNLIVPSFPGTVAWMPKWSCEYLKNLFLPDKPSKTNLPKRIYISRNKSNNRRLINEQEIINFLAKYNFEIVNLELLSIQKQAEILSQAEIIVSPHGSGLSNIVFCQPSTIIIEIFSPHYIYPCYWLVSNLIHLDYYYLIGETIGSLHFHQLLYPDSRLEDIYLNVKKLELLLSNLAIF